MAKSLISRDKGTCFGQPHIRGTRITVSCIKGWANDLAEIKRIYPQLSIEKINAALNYGKKNNNKNENVQKVCDYSRRQYAIFGSLHNFQV